MTNAPTGATRGRWRRHAPALTILAALLLAAVMAGFSAQQSRAANNLPAPGYQVTAISPTTNLDDGQTVIVNVKANPDVKIFDLAIRECVGGQSYTEASDVDFVTGKCPQTGVSSSADSVVHRSSSTGLIEATQSDGGATTAFRVGQGSAPLGGPAGGNITCDPTHQCLLVVKLVLAGPSTVYWTTPLSFGTFDPLVGCGGPASGIVASGGSDQLQEAFSAWTVGVCKEPGAAGAPTRASFTGEGDAVKSFANGELDLAYTAVGDNPDVAIAGSGAPSRAAVATPLALNAAVIAVGGGKVTALGEKAPYSDIQLKASDVAALFTGGVVWVVRDDKPYKVSILGDNPELGGTLFAQVPVSRPMGPSEAESSSWFMTDYLRKLAPDDWTVPFTTIPRGASAALATASPEFAAGTLDLFSGRPILSKVVSTAAASLTNGPVWAMTDLATAKALGMTPVAIENANGVFVKPTAESLTAAVDTMKQGANGLLMPDPTATATATASGVKGQAAVEPYPLTFVEYGYAPAEPLVDATCTARTASQALLANWLRYTTGKGQADLPAGLAPLPPALGALAQSTIATVGASPVTGACAGKVGPGTGVGAPGGTTANFPVSGVSAPVGAKVPGVTGAETPAGGGVADSAVKRSVVAVPAFAGRKVIGATGSIIALLGIVLVTSLAAWITAGGDLAGAGPGAGASAPLTPKRVGSIALLWGAVAVAGVGLVVFQLGPLLAQRDQRALLHDYRVQVRHAANEIGTLQGVTVATTPPERGAPVGILEIGALQTQDVVVEGVGAAQTSEAPGHVPGTVGLGQPGNAVVVARRNGYGASFQGLDQLRRGDRIVVTTTQGQSVYSVRKVRTTSIEAASSDAGSTSGSTTATVAPTTTLAPPTTSTPDAVTSTTTSGTGAAARASTASASTATGKATFAAQHDRRQALRALVRRPPHARHVGEPHAVELVHRDRGRRQAAEQALRTDSAGSAQQRRNRDGG